jgi:WS/DGAT/MGAT family acyltransferase
MLHTDAFAWYMESDPALRSTVVAVAVLDRVPDWHYLKARVERMTRAVPRLRQRVQQPPLRIGPPRWVVDDGFDLDYHMRRVRLPEPGDWAAVLQAARVAAMADFDRARPLWEFTLLEGLPDGRAALVTKLHHALSDGIGGMQLAALMVDLTPQMPPLDELPAAPPGGALNTTALLVASLRDNTAEMLGVAVRAGLASPRAAAAMRHPLAATTATLDTVASVARIVRPIVHQASPVMTARRMTRRLDTMDIPLSALHDAAAAHGGHVNDAFLAAVTGGLRRYHERHGATVGDLRVTVPVSIRKPNDPIGGNRITLLRFAVPIGVADPAERLMRIARIIGAGRRERALALTQGIAFGLNLAPRSYLQGILRRVDFLASDVPGLTAPVYVAGARVLAYYPFGPTIGAAFNTTLMSYVDACNIGVTIDDAAVPDADALIADLHAGFDEVLGLSGSAPRAVIDLTSDEASVR